MGASGQVCVSYMYQGWHDFMQSEHQPEWHPPHSSLPSSTAAGEPTWDPGAVLSQNYFFHLMVAVFDQILSLYPCNALNYCYFPSAKCLLAQILIIWGCAQWCHVFVCARLWLVAQAWMLNRRSESPKRQKHHHNHKNDRHKHHSHKHHHHHHHKHSKKWVGERETERAHASKRERFNRNARQHRAREFWIFFPSTSSSEYEQDTHFLSFQMNANKNACTQRQEAPQKPWPWGVSHSPPHLTYKSTCYIYIYIYIHTYIYICICIYAYAKKYIPIHAYAYTYMHTCIHTHVYTCLNQCIQTCIHTNKRTNRLSVWPRKGKSGHHTF